MSVDSTSPDQVTGRGRPQLFADPLYQEIRVSYWATWLLETSPFQRLGGISLSDVPGELLFGRPFPTRLEHTRGVYALARLARPRDRALQAAALAHDLGHGPFSHLTEPLMREFLGQDHEERSTRLLRDMRDALSPSARRQLAWLDWDEVGELVLGTSGDGRGALLNGLLDYDNLDNVARFLNASGLGIPSYDPHALARSLKVGPGPEDGTYLLPSCREEALRWLADRARVYGYLHDGHRNLAAHAMLRKAIDLVADAGHLPPGFFDMTDGQALDLVRARREGGAGRLAGRVVANQLYACVWEAVVPDESGLVALTGRWRERLRLESALAAEAGLLPHEVVTDVVVSSAARQLPPLGLGGPVLGYGQPSPRIFHLFVAPSASRDYLWRLRGAAERHLAAYGARARGEHASVGTSYSSPAEA